MLKTGITLLVLPGLLLMLAWWFDYKAALNCLQAGGAYDYLAQTCLHDGSQPPFVSFAQRHPFWVNGFLVISLLGLGLTMGGLYRRRQQSR